MECVLCREERLCHEFPSKGPTSLCDHLPSSCLWCIAEAWKHSNRECPNCEFVATEEDVREIVDALQHLACPVFKDLDNVRASKKEACTSVMSIENSGDVHVALLDGQRCSFEISKYSSLRELKERIERRFHIPVSQQRLMHAGQEVKGDDLVWKDAGILYGSVLQLVVIMYDTGSVDGVRTFTFDLSWDGRVKRLASGKYAVDHLNGSCIALDKFGNFLTSVDFLNLSWGAGSIRHHGPSSKRDPRQKITVSTRSLGSDVFYLFFTLSAFAPGGITMSNFVNPKVELRDAERNATLASYTAGTARYGEAVVLCCAKKLANCGAWRVQRIGSTSDGNVKMPEELIKSVEKIARSGSLV
eukprot:TRINITY_DN7754_c0_g1_i1.p1 TRINITY_DN7754_c0_g1~~TRINITY_DN7754_c0_g1_i1.p1  ORF type:complete len:358 (+),score=43.46 TRINITY_DN7754_c0_g1_i1:80-1153(+)